MNFVYEPLQFDRLTKLVEFNTLLCIDTIKEELAEIVAKRKQIIPRLNFQDVVNTYKRLSSFSSANKGSNDLKLKMSAKHERELKRMFSVEESDNSDGDYVDALDNIPNDTTNL